MLRCSCKENKPSEILNPKEQTWRGLECALSKLKSKLSKYESQPRKSILLPFIGVKESQLGKIHPYSQFHLLKHVNLPLLTYLKKGKY